MAEDNSPSQPSNPVYHDPLQPPTEPSHETAANPVSDASPDRLNQLNIEREDWNQRAGDVPLPEGTHIEAGMIAGVPCERVTVGEIPNDYVIILMHGGGFNSGSVLTHRALAARLSLAAGIHVMIVDYRLAPEHPFPAALDDGVLLYRGLLASTTPQMLFLLGDSAGANLVVAMMLALRAHGDPLPNGAILLSPWLDLGLSGESIETNHDQDSISREALQAAVEDYLTENSRSQPTDLLISPLFADLTGLPSILIQVGDRELLLSDSLRFAASAQAVGVDVTLEVWPQMQHRWHGDASLPESQEAIDAIASFIRSQFADDPPDTDPPDVVLYDGSL